MATPWLRAARRTSSLVASQVSGTGAASTAAGSTRSGSVVDRLELRVATGDGQLAAPGRGSRGPCGPPTSSSPSRPCAAARRRRGRGPWRPRGPGPGRGPASTRPGLVAQPRPPPRALAEGLHPVPHHRPQVDRHEGLDVRPVLDHPARLLLRGPPEHLGVVGTHPREQRHVVGPLEHVDRVDLEHAGAREGAGEGAHRRGGVARIAEPLGDQGDPPRLGAAQRFGRRHAATYGRATTDDRSERVRGCRGASRARRT